MSEKFLLDSKSELIDYLSEYPFYKNKESTEQYNFMWMANLFLACADNLNKYALPIEIEEFGENLILTKEQVIFIKRLADSLEVQDYK